MHAAATLRQPLARCGKRGKHLSQHGFVLPSDAYTFQASLCRHGRARQRCVGRMSGGELLWFRGRAAGGALQRRRWTVAFRVRRHALRPGQAGDPQREGDAELQRAETCPQPRGCRARPPAKAPQPAPLPPSDTLFDSRRIEGVGTLSLAEIMRLVQQNPRLRDEVDAAQRESGKEGGRDPVHRQADRQLEEPRGGSRAARTPARSVTGGSGTRPPSCASAVPRASTIRPSATSPPRTRRRSTRATRAGRGPPPSRGLASGPRATARPDMPPSTASSAPVT